MTRAAKKAQPRFIDDYLLYLLALASHQASGEFHAQLKGLGVPVPIWRVLGALSDADMTVSDLARDGLMNQPTMTKVIDRMVRDGLVERRPAEGDRRKVLVRITDRGRAKVVDLRHRAKRHETELLAEYGTDEVVRLKAMLRTLIRRSRARRTA